MTVHEPVPDYVANLLDSHGKADVIVPTGIGDDFPVLHSTVARPVVQDRWERLVSEVVIPASAETVWAALTEPAAVALWFGRISGQWATEGAESMLDFDDGEFFYCRTEIVTPVTNGRPGVLHYLWRWVGIGPAASVTWTVRANADADADADATTVTVTEQAVNPPSDWRSWNGMGWPGILEQLAGYLRTHTDWRWPWRRMGPYVQAVLAAPPYEAWEAVSSSAAVKHWLQRSAGTLDPDGEPMTIVMGDASGTALLDVRRRVDAGQEFPSFLPYLEFELGRPGWERRLGGRLWIEPAGLGRSLLQVFHHGWEGLSLPNPLEERRILTGFWIGAFRRASSMFAPPGGPPQGGQGAQPGPHGWST